MRYRARKVSNVEEYLYGAIGDATPLTPKWELHSVVPSMFDEDKVKVTQWLVILQTTDKVPEPPSE